jgi:hypothetical protein
MTRTAPVCHACDSRSPSVLAVAATRAVDGLPFLSQWCYPCRIASLNPAPGAVQIFSFVEILPAARVFTGGAA